MDAVQRYTEFADLRMTEFRILLPFLRILSACFILFPHRTRPSPLFPVSFIFTSPAVLFLLPVFSSTDIAAVHNDARRVNRRASWRNGVSSEPIRYR